MAKVRPSEIIDLTAALERFGQNSSALEAKILKAIESSKNLSSSVVKELAKIEKRAIKQQVDLAKKISKLTKDYDKLTEEKRKELQASKEQFEQNEKLINTLEKLTDSTESLTSKTKAMGTSIAAASLAFKAMDLILDTLSAAFSLATKAYDNWFRLEQNWMSSMAALRMEHGLSVEQARQAQLGIEALRHEYGNLTSEVDGIAITSQYFGEISNAIRMAGGELNNYMTTLAAVRRITGLSGESLNQIFRLVATGAPDANRAMEDWMAGTEDLADQLLVPVGQIRQQFVAASSDIARFGSQGMIAFRNAATMASRFGIEASKVFQMIKKFDTFQAGSDAVNNLNAILGTTLSSFELMMETDPTARLERVRQAVFDTGQSWDEMNHFQRDAIAQMLDIPVEEARRLFMENASFEDLERERQKREARQTQDENLRMNNTQRLNDMLRTTQEIMEDWSRTAQRIWNIVSEAIAPIFREVFGITSETREELLSWVEAFSQTTEFQDGVREVAISIRDTWAKIKEEISDSNITFDDFKSAAAITFGIMKGIGEIIGGFYDGFVLLVDLIKDFADGLSFAWEMVQAIKDGDFEEMGRITQERLVDDQGRISLPGAESINSLAGNPFLASANSDLRENSASSMSEIPDFSSSFTGLSTSGIRKTAKIAEQSTGVESAPILDRTINARPSPSSVPVVNVNVNNNANTSRMIETVVDTAIGR